MAINHIQHVRVVGISAAVPGNVIDVSQSNAFSNAEEKEKFMRNVGVTSVHRHDGSMTCADLCQAAAEKLLQNLGWDPKEVDLLIYASGARDYPLPATACVLHGEMGLKEECSCFDIPHGCSGWVYGTSVVGGLMQGGGYKKALLLSGDAEPSGPECPSRADLPMFGDAGTATAFLYDEASPEIVTDTRTDGTGYEAIIWRSGGHRHPVDSAALELKTDPFGRTHRAVDMEMDGVSTFVFAISRVPRIVQDMLIRTSQRMDDVDYFVFHQANLMINEQIRKKCQIPMDKCPFCIQEFGNTSPGSIPLTMVTRIREQLMEDAPRKIIACGFGVGLSWGAVSFETRSLAIPLLIEL